MMVVRCAAIITTRGRWVNDSKPASKLIESPLLVLSAMGLGFNSNVELGATVYHVQTEDRGLHHPFVDTVVLSRRPGSLPPQR